MFSAFTFKSTSTNKVYKRKNLIYNSKGKRLIQVREYKVVIVEVTSFVRLITTIEIFF